MHIHSERLPKRDAARLFGTVEKFKPVSEALIQTLERINANVLIDYDVVLGEVFDGIKTLLQW